MASAAAMADPLKKLNSSSPLLVSKTSLAHVPLTTHSLYSCRRRVGREGEVQKLAGQYVLPQPSRTLVRSPHRDQEGRMGRGQDGAGR